ncbi:MAG TPA: germination protein YpeB [Syntrophomonadaceae bacterium]|nr:germination protein YpeB [Syntrophomonadaceae bacterium]
MKWSRQTLAIAALSVLWGLTALWGIGQLNARRQADALLQNKYNRAFYESLQRTKNVEALLSKGLASANTEQMDTLFSDLWYNANAAQENLHQLPLSHNVVARTSKFLAQVGDYAYSLAKRNRSQPLSDKDWKTMQRLYSTAVSVNRQMALVDREARTGRLRWKEVTGGLSSRLPRQSLTTAADQSFRRVDAQLQEVPVLLYDGPFSDHIQRRTPLGLTGDMITSGQAQQIARRFVDFAGTAPGSAKVVRNIGGKIPAYSIEFRTGTKTADVIRVDVSKKGGHVVYYLNSRSVPQVKISDDRARILAQNFLTSRGIKNMVPTYTLRERNILFVNFAYKQDNVIVYPDLMKVQVALDNGQILGYEALGFLMSHHRRDLPAPKLTMEQARAKVSPRLQVLSERMAVVPTTGLNEVLTYEFKARLGEDTFLVYINALTGDEERIFKLIRLPNGTLTL